MPAPDILPSEVVDQWFYYQITPEMRNALIKELSGPICDLLGLDDWKIDYKHDPELLDADGRCSAQWRYQDATISFRVKEWDLGDFVETMFHEHLHLLLAPMEQAGELEGDMYRVDPASESFIKGTVDYFIERQVAELRTTLGKRMGRLLGVNTHDWLMTLAIRHLEENYDSSLEAQTAGSGEHSADSERGNSRASFARAAAYAPVADGKRHLHPGAGPRSATAWRRSGRR